jgi:hypothetical protein
VTTSLRVYDRANETLLATLDTTDTNGLTRAPLDVKAQDKLNEAGTGSVTVMADHPAAPVLLGGNVVRFYENETCVWAFTIISSQVVEVGEESERQLKVSGVGLLGRWTEALVEPWNANEGRPVSLDRVWNWASPQLDTSGWQDTVYTQTWANSQWARLPEAWPKATPATEWIWSRVESNVQPVGWSLFRYTRSFASPVTVAIYVAANSTFEVWIDGVLLDREPNRQPDRTGYEKSRRYVVPVSVGVHDFAFGVENWGGSESDNPAGLAASVWAVRGDELDDLLFTSRNDDSDWLCEDYPNPYPGWTPIEILSMCLTEAQARGELVGWSIDDNGETYPEIEEFAARVGRPLGTVIDALTATYVDVEVDPTDLLLRVWPKDVGVGTATSVTLDPDLNVSYLSRTTSDEIVNAVLGVWEQGTRWRVRGASVTANGRRAATLQAGNVGNRRSLDQILDAYLDAYAEPGVQIVAQVVPTAGAVAGIDYRVGDTVTLDGETVRCVGLTWTLEPDGSLLATPEFDTPFGVRQQEKLRAVERLTDAFDAPATASIIDRDALLNTGIVGTTRESYSWSGDIEETLDTDDPDNPWQPFRVDRTQRIYGFRAEIPAEYVPDATDDTVIQLLVNGSAIATLTLEVADAAAEVDLPPDTVVLPKDLISVRCTSAGGHVDGSIDILMADPV